MSLRRVEAAATLRWWKCEGVKSGVFPPLSFRLPLGAEGSKVDFGVRSTMLRKTSPSTVLWRVGFSKQRLSSDED
jgi:hypothetical protein